jgi:hypothetical protein
MGLAVDFNIRQSDNARELSFTETTGTYHVSDNPGGWGAPNDTTSDPTVVEIKVTAPNESEATIDMLIPASGFPTTDKTIEYIIRSQDIGLGTDEQLPDGIWTIKYEITTPGETAVVSSVQKIFISGKARCCVNKMLASVDLCDCDSSQLKDATKAHDYLKVARACAGCGDSVKFVETLEIINALCNGNCC